MNNMRFFIYKTSAGTKKMTTIKMYPYQLI